MIWHLKKGMDRRFRAGHPWVFSNELRESPRGIEPGAGVELRDSAGQFLARGYGNPNSLIAFRCLSRDPKVLEPMGREFFQTVLETAERTRHQLGFRQVSHRLCFGEGDGLPGFVVDRYVLEDGAYVDVIQAHTAGADRLVSSGIEVLTRSAFLRHPEGRQAIVVRNDLTVRKVEGLEKEAPRIVQDLPGSDLRQAMIRVRAVDDGHPLLFETDLIEGQKTGFFLDQYSNIQLAALRLEHVFNWVSQDKIRILDLCCYVGQWSAQLTRFFRSRGKTVEVLAVDASEKSLAFAEKNIRAEGAVVQTWKADVIEDLPSLPVEKQFDLVISDPPALIKSRKDLPVGSHAYLRLATEVFRRVTPLGAVVACSCSAVLEEEAFLQIQNKAVRRARIESLPGAGVGGVQWIGRGSPSADHPMLSEFPEGRYLKCWVGLATGPKV